MVNRTGYIDAGVIVEGALDESRTFVTYDDGTDLEYGGSYTLESSGRGLHPLAWPQSRGWRRLCLCSVRYRRPAGACVREGDEPMTYDQTMTDETVGQEEMPQELEARGMDDLMEHLATEHDADIPQPVRDFLTPEGLKGAHLISHGHHPVEHDPASLH